MAGPRPAAGQISATTPPELVGGTEAKKPERNRVMRNVWMFGARAWPRCKIVYSIIGIAKIGLRPTSSLPGPQKSG